MVMGVKQQGMSQQDAQDEAATEDEQEELFFRNEDEDQPFRYGRGVGHSFEMDIPRHNGSPSTTNMLLSDSPDKQRNMGELPVAVGEHRRKDGKGRSVTVRRVFTISKTTLFEFVRVTREVPHEGGYKVREVADDVGEMSQEVFTGFKRHECNQNGLVSMDDDSDPVPVEVVIPQQHTASPIADFKRDYSGWREAGYEDIRTLAESLGSQRGGTPFAHAVVDDRALLSKAEV